MLGSLKNWRIGIIRCLTNHHFPIVDCLVDDDVISTSKKLVQHCLTKWPDDKLRLHPLFLHTKPKWRASDQVWFTASAIDHN